MELELGEAHQIEIKTLWQSYSIFFLKKLFFCSRQRQKKRGTIDEFLLEIQRKTKGAENSYETFLKKKEEV